MIVAMLIIILAVVIVETIIRLTIGIRYFFSSVSGKCSVSDVVEKMRQISYH